MMVADCSMVRFELFPQPHLRSPPATAVLPVFPSASTALSSLACTLVVIPQTKPAISSSTKMCTVNDTGRGRTVCWRCASAISSRISAGYTGDWTDGRRQRWLWRWRAASRGRGDGGERKLSACDNAVSCNRRGGERKLQRQTGEESKSKSPAQGGGSG